MTKPFIFLIVFAVVGVILFYPNKPQTPIYYPPQTIPAPLSSQNLDNLNLRNDAIRSIYYPNIVIKSSGVKLNASLIYEKPKYFRMINSSLLGKEADIGSNDTIFWFWSKRMKPPALFYANHEDLHQTNLRTPFHPAWMMEIVGVDSLDLKKSEILPFQGKIAVIQNKMSIQGVPIHRIYLIDPKTFAYLGHYIFDEKMRPIVSVDVTDFHVVNSYWLPKELFLTWHEENLQIKWELDIPQLNVPGSTETWQPPAVNQQINLKGYIP